jgi:2-keto-4-pentenoate hydratase/2-oxohepta-3-ene-1,7-dioic acid hydratase in catechol pathway
MRLFGFVSNGGPAIGVDLGGDRGAEVLPLADFYADVPAGLAAARAVLEQAVSDDVPTVLDLTTLLQVPAVPTSAKVVCIGLNYASHAAETGQGTPAAPTVFARWASTLNVDGGVVEIPTEAVGLDWEAELAVVIGESAYEVSVADAPAKVFAYTGFNDVTERDRQLSSSQWTLGKNVPGSGPLGPALVTRDEVPEPVDLRVMARVNGVVMQDARTTELIFSIPELISYVSQTVRLEPGDVIATGTPAGVGIARNPRVLLHDGDTVDVDIETIGVLHTRVVASRQAAARGAGDLQPATARENAEERA